MITPSQAKSLETFTRSLTIVESPVGEPTPLLAKQLLDDLGPDHVIRTEWAYALFIEIGTEPSNAQGYGATTMTSERSADALSEAIAQFWQQLGSEGVF